MVRRASPGTVVGFLRLGWEIPDWEIPGSASCCCSMWEVVFFSLLFVALLTHKGVWPFSSVQVP